MSKKKHTAEEIVTKMRETDVLLAKSQSIAEACSQLQISDQTAMSADPKQSSLLKLST